MHLKTFRLGLLETILATGYDIKQMVGHLLGHVHMRRNTFRPFQAMPGGDTMKSLPALLMLLLPLASQAATPVTLKTLAELWFEQEQSAPATVIALNAPLVSSELNARVVSLHVDSGDRVMAGDLLLELDCRLAEANLHAAQAGLSQFQAQYSYALHQVRRADDLLKKRNISDQEVEQRKSEEQRLAAQIDAQEAAIEQARIQVDNCRITAPFDGVVTERLADAGMLATVGTPLLKLLQTAPLEVSARINASESSAVAKSKSLWFETDDERHAVILRTIIPYVDTATATREARLRFRDEAPIAGTAGRLKWLVSDRSVPAEYLLRRNGRLGIFRFEDGKARFVALDKALEGQPAIIEMAPETLLIDQGRESLNEGDAVLDASASPQAPADAEASSPDDSR